MTAVRATSIYLTMILVLGAGIALVLRAGTGLRAPADLSGGWDVAWEGTPPRDLGSKSHLWIDQSGRYFVLTFDERLRLRLHLEDGAALAPDRNATEPLPPRSMIADLRGDERSVVLARGTAPETFELALDDGVAHTAIVRRSAR